MPRYMTGINSVWSLEQLFLKGLSLGFVDNIVFAATTQSHDREKLIINNMQINAKGCVSLKLYL